MSVPTLQAAASSVALLLLCSAAHAQPQVFSADAAIGIEIDSAAQVNAGVENVDAEEVSGDAGPGPVPDLERQDLIPTGPYIRMCDCNKVRTVVRLPLSRTSLPAIV